jgi:hypothetical protein
MTVHVRTRCPQGSSRLGYRSSASGTKVHDVDRVLRVEDLVVKVIPAPPQEQTADVAEERARCATPRLGYVLD